MGNRVAERGTQISAIGGKWTNRGVESKFPQSQRIPEQGSSSQGEGRGLPVLNQAHQGHWRPKFFAIAGGHRAIIRKGNNSHGCYAFRVEKRQRSASHECRICIYKE